MQVIFNPHPTPLRTMSPAKIQDQVPLLAPGRPSVFSGDDAPARSQVIAGLKPMPTLPLEPVLDLEGPPRAVHEDASSVEHTGGKTPVSLVFGPQIDVALSRSPSQHTGRISRDQAEGLFREWIYFFTVHLHGIVRAGGAETVSQRQVRGVGASAPIGQDLAAEGVEIERESVVVGVAAVVSLPDASRVHHHLDVSGTQLVDPSLRKGMATEAREGGESPQRISPAEKWLSEYPGAFHPGVAREREPLRAAEKIRAQRQQRPPVAARAIILREHQETAVVVIADLRQRPVGANQDCHRLDHLFQYLEVGPAEGAPLFGLHEGREEEHFGDERVVGKRGFIVQPVSCDLPLHLGEKFLAGELSPPRSFPELGQTQTAEVESGEVRNIVIPTDRTALQVIEDEAGMEKQGLEKISPEPVVTRPAKKPFGCQDL